MSETVKRRQPLLRPTLLMLVDAGLLEVAFLVTYWFRFHAGVWKVPLGIPPLDVYLTGSAIVLAVFFGLFYYLGLYSEQRMLSVEEQLVGVLKGIVLGSMGVLALTFFIRAQTFSRSFFGLFVLSASVLLCAGRLVNYKILARVTRDVGGRPLLLVGGGPMREQVRRAAAMNTNLGLNCVGWIDVSPDVGGPDTGGSCPRLGGLADLREIVDSRGIEVVALTLPLEQQHLVGRITGSLANLNVDVHLVPDMQGMAVSRVRLTELGGIPFLSVRAAALSGADRIVKRSFDVVATAGAMIVLSPFFALIALLVKLSSPGPVFYGQDRIGRDGREFRMMKFRTMRPDAESSSGPVWTVEDDPRVTRIGGFLRRYSLDELPQIWNVLVGDMSLVGPRPERRHFVDQFVLEMPRYFERHRVRSGLTGWAQVNGLRGNTSIAERTVYDLYYVENWSLGLDLRIILMTIHHVLKGENAY